jgi:tripartite ATP-independent transporter DctM subunit
MEPIAIGIIGFIALFVLMFMGMHIGFALALVSFVGFAVICGFDPALSIAGRIPFSVLASYTFSLFPLFMLMGEFAASSGMMRDAYYAANTWLGHLPGGLAMATIGGCGAFAAVCGNSAATAATMSRVSLPEMLKYQYSPSLATGCIAAGGTLGILIPPSTAFIVYGMITEQSIGRLLMAGVTPGLVKVALYMITIFLICQRNPSLGPPGQSTSLRQKMASLKGLWGVLALFLLVMGGIWGGIFTPTEAGSIGVLGTLAIGLIGRKLNRRNIFPTFLASLATCGMAFVLMNGAMLFTYFISVSRVAVTLAETVNLLPLPPLGIVIVILVIYLVMGCLMDALSMTLVTIPIFAPIISALGLDLIWFGVIVVVMIEIAMITPPIGANVFLIAGMAPDIPMYTIFKGIMPFLAADFILIALLIAFPQISLLLPSTMMAMK